MKTTLLALTVLMGFSSQAQSYVIDTEACAGTEYIYDDLGMLVEYDPSIHTYITETTPVFYAGYEHISYISLRSTRRFYIVATNISDRLVSFFYRPTYTLDSTGAPSAISPETFNGSFSTSNSPLAAGGADLAAGHAGRISVYSPTAHYGTASIYWDSSVCGTAPILAHAETQFTASSRIGINIEHVNGGKPF